jgi:hypothetical protein
MDEDYKEIELNGVKLRVFRNGTIMRYINKTARGHSMGWNICKLIPHKYEGYYKIGINKKNVAVHRLIAMVYLGLDINNITQQIDHIDRIRTNNNVNNLRLITHKENCYNKTCKGYYFKTDVKKFCSQIRLNYKLIHLGYFDTEEDARNAYIEAKAKYHIINPHPLQL